MPWPANSRVLSLMTAELCDIFAIGSGSEIRSMVSCGVAGCG